MTTTTRYRIYLYTSVEQFEEGMATATEIVDGDMALGAVLRKWFTVHGPKADAFILDLVPDPRF